MYTAFCVRLCKTFAQCMRICIGCTDFAYVCVQFWAMYADLCKLNGFCELSGLCVSIQLLDSFNVSVIQSLGLFDSFDVPMIWSWDLLIGLTFVRPSWCTTRSIRPEDVIFRVLLPTIYTFWLHCLEDPFSGFCQDLYLKLFTWSTVRILPWTVSC